MTLRRRDRIALGVVGTVAVIAAFYLLVLAPVQRRASQLATAITGQRQALAQAQGQYAAGRAARSSLRAHAAEWAALDRAVPNTSNIPALLRVLERNATVVGVDMQAVQLSGGSSSSSPAAPTAAGSSSATGTGAGGATSVPLSLTFAGGYRALHRLVTRLDGLAAVSGNTVHASGPLLSISNVSLSGSPKLTVQLTAAIYQRASAKAATTPGGA